MCQFMSTNIYCGTKWSRITPANTIIDATVKTGIKSIELRNLIIGTIIHQRNYTIAGTQPAYATVPGIIIINRFAMIIMSTDTGKMR